MLIVELGGRYIAMHYVRTCGYSYRLSLNKIIPLSQV